MSASNVWEFLEKAYIYSQQLWDVVLEICKDALEMRKEVDFSSKSFPALSQLTQANIDDIAIHIPKFLRDVFRHYEEQLQKSRHSHAALETQLATQAERFTATIADLEGQLRKARESKSESRPSGKTETHNENVTAAARMNEMMTNNVLIPQRVPAELQLPDGNFVQGEATLIGFLTADEVRLRRRLQQEQAKPALPSSMSKGLDLQKTDAAASAWGRLQRLWA